jgi:hypothetical protein
MSKLAIYLNKISTDYMNKHPWIKELNPAQRAVHNVHSQINVDCHNEYLSNILIKMDQTIRYKYAQTSYLHIVDSLRDRPNDSSVPSGVILRRLTNVEAGRTRSMGFGKNFNEVTGTLFYKHPDKDHLQSTCKIKTMESKFYHPFYWEVPTPEEIDKVLTFSTQYSKEELLKIMNHPIKTAIKETVSKLKPKKKTESEEEVQKLNEWNRIRDLQRLNITPDGQPMAMASMGLRAMSQNYMQGYNAQSFSIPTFVGEGD